MGWGTYENPSALGVRVVHQSPLFGRELGSTRAQAVEQLPVLLRSFVKLMLDNHDEIPLDSIA